MADPAEVPVVPVVPVEALVVPVVAPVVPEVHPAAVVPEAPVVPEPVVPAEPVTTEDPVVPEGNSELDSTGFKFNGMEVTVEVPADLREELAGKGVDVNAVVSELYKSEDFTLSAETKEKLYTVYGKTVVDSYLLGLKAQNEVALRAHSDSQAANTAANEQAWVETVEQLGGEDRWAALEEWAGATFTDAEFKEFNNVMESGSRYAQKLAVSDLMARHKATEGDAAPVLVAGELSPPMPNSVALSATEYRNGFTSGEYKKDPKGWDARRRKGQELGI